MGQYVLICLMAAILLALSAAKQRQVGGQSWQGAVSGAQLFMAGWLFLLLFTLCGSVLTYMGQAVTAPLQDHTFAVADAALGLDFVRLSRLGWNGAASAGGDVRRLQQLPHTVLDRFSCLRGDAR